MDSGWVTDQWLVIHSVYVANDSGSELVADGELWIMVANA